MLDLIANPSRSSARMEPFLDEGACLVFLKAAHARDRQGAQDALAPLVPGLHGFVRASLTKLGDRTRKSGLSEDDVAQEVVLKLLDWVPDDVPESHARAKLLAWCSVVARNLVLNALRRRERDASERNFAGVARADGEGLEGPDAQLDRLAAKRQDDDTTLDLRRVLALVKRAATTLDAPYDAVLELALEVDDLTADTMALHFGKLTEDEIDAVTRREASPELAAHVKRQRALMDKWKSRMREKLAALLVEAVGERELAELLPDGLRFERFERGTANANAPYQAPRRSS